MKMIKLAATILLFLVVTRSPRAQSTSAPAPSPEVPLLPGTCPQVADGDTVILDWNPGFLAWGICGGLRDFALSFGLRGKERSHRGGGLTLRVATLKTESRTDQAIADIGNGFFRLRFKVNLHAVEPGEYHLVRADAEANADGANAGGAPQMTNSPTRYSFCVDVLPTPSRGSRVPHS